MKHLGGNPTKYVQDLYAKNYKTLTKETKNISKWIHMPNVRDFVHQFLMENNPQGDQIL